MAVTRVCKIGQRSKGNFISICVNNPGIVFLTLESV